MPNLLFTQDYFMTNYNASAGIIARDNMLMRAGGLKATKTITLTGNNTTVNVSLFTLTGSVKVLGIEGTVTTQLGANHTAAYLNLYDSSAAVDISLNTGTTLSAAPVGSVLGVIGNNTAALDYQQSNQARYSAATNYSFRLIAKNGATNTIRYTYSTTDTPTSGVIQWDIYYIPISTGTIVAV